MLRCLLSFLAPILVIGSAVAEDIKIHSLALASGIDAISVRDDGVIVVEDKERRRFGLSFSGNSPILQTLRDPDSSSNPSKSDGLPDGETAKGRGAIAEAWLAGPTGRYNHGVLGDAVEASEVRVAWRDGGSGRFPAGEDAVFEDRMVRMADVDGDGSEDLVVVRSYLEKGAAVLAIRAQDGVLSVLGESEPIGRPNRWLNPVGIADFDGDRKPEIAVVTTPHIGGTLRFYQLRRGRLVEELSQPGYSNHILGSRVLDMAVVLDLNGDEVSDILLPADDLRRLVAVTANRGEMTVLWELRHQSPVVTSVLARDIEGDGLPDIVYGLEDGTLVLISRKVRSN